jgi:hypothetical protein
LSLHHQRADFGTVESPIVDLWEAFLPNAPRYAIAALVIAAVLAGIGFAIVFALDRGGRRD